MFYLPCVDCSQPTAISDFHCWLQGDPACSEGCAERARATGRYDKQPDAAKVIQETLDLLRDTGERVRSAADRAGGAESTLHMAATLQSGPAFLLVGAMPGAVAGMMHESSMNNFEAAAADIDLRLQRVVRKMMVLEALGFGVAAHLGPFVTKFGNLTTSSPGGMRAVLVHLWEHLKYLHDGVLGIQRGLTGS